MRRKGIQQPANEDDGDDIESAVVHLAKIGWVTRAIGLRAGEADSPSASVVEHTTSRPDLNFKHFPLAWKYKET